MTRFRAFEDGALEARLRRLRRTEADLQGRVQARIAEADRAGRWVPTDPTYRGLSAVLQKVRRELQATEQEQQRRQAVSDARPVRSPKRAPLSRNGRTSAVLGPKLMNA